MSLSDLARLSALLVRLGRYPAPLPIAGRVDERECRTPGGLVYDLLEPRRPPLGSVIAVHGATLNGGRDRRLQHFGRCLALGGVRCVLPTLPGLADLRWSPGDIDALCGCLGELQGPQPIGLIGFSYAGSYALLAAARPEVAARVAFVLTFGAVASFPQVYDHALATRVEEPRDALAWDDRIYRELVLAWRHRVALGLEPTLSARIEALLRSFCQEPSSAEKRAFFEEHLRPLDLIAHDHRTQDRPSLEALSPLGRLSGLRCPVGLFHDPADGLVPAAQAAALFAELQALPGRRRHRLLVTRMLSHISLSGVLAPGQLASLFSMLMPLVAPARALT